MAYNVDTVRRAQESMNNMGYSPALTTDGKEGPLTDKAVVWARNNGASVDGESNSLAKLTDGFLLAIGVTPSGFAQTSGSNVQYKPPQGGYGGGSSTQAPLGGGPAASYVSFGPPPGSGGSGGGPLNVKPPLPPGPAPKPAPPPLPAKPSPIPAAVGAGAGAGLGWFAVGGPLAALIGGAVGGIGGYLFGKKSAAPTMGAEVDTPSTRYFTASCTALAHNPAHYYRYAPKAVVDAMASYAAACMHPGVAMVPAVRRFGKWEGRRAGQSITLYGPPYHQARMGCEQ